MKNHNFFSVSILVNENMSRMSWKTELNAAEVKE